MVVDAAGRRQMVDQAQSLNLYVSGASSKSWTIHVMGG